MPLGGTQCQWQCHMWKPKVDTVSAVCHILWKCSCHMLIAGRPDSIVRMPRGLHGTSTREGVSCSVRVAQDLHCTASYCQYSVPPLVRACAGQEGAILLHTLGATCSLVERELVLGR